MSGGQYEIEIVLVFGSPAGGGTPDLKVDVGEDATARGSFASVASNPTGSVAQTLGFSNQTNAFTFGTDVTDRIAMISGCHYAAGGTFRVRWAQNTSHGNATIVRAGSLIRYRRIV